MYSLYVEMFGKNICENIGNELQPCKYVSDCHGEFGYNSSMLFEHIKNSNINAIFTTDMTYNYVSNYKVTRYFTEDENGSLKFWKYDFIGKKALYRLVPVDFDGQDLDMDVNFVTDYICLQS